VVIFARIDPCSCTEGAKKEGKNKNTSKKKPSRVGV
jgi:hypothetical protein